MTRLRKSMATTAVARAGLARELPERWRAGEKALHAVQVAFDVNEQVLEAVRTAAFNANLSNSDQIRLVLQLPVVRQIKRPRLTITLSDADYRLLAERFGLAEDDRLGIKERAAQELLVFADTQKSRMHKPRTSKERIPKEGLSLTDSAEHARPKERHP